MAITHVRIEQIEWKGAIYINLFHNGFTGNPQFQR